LADEALKSAAREFGAKYGLGMLLDVCLGALNNALVLNGVLTKSELRESYAAALKRATEREGKVSLLLRVGAGRKAGK
jgi:hypothetical protein